MSDAIAEINARADELGVFAFADAVGWRYRRTGHTAVGLCVTHEENTPSRTLRIGRQRTLVSYCFGCQTSLDAFGFAARVMGYDPKHDTKRAIEIVAGQLGVRLDDVDRRAAPRPPPPRPSLETWTANAYPPGTSELWARCLPVTSDDAAREYLDGRSLDSEIIARRDLARALPAGPLPPWASIHGMPWRTAGYTLVVPCFNAHGAITSLRATLTAPRSVVRDDPRCEPKRAAPKGHTSTRLVFASPSMQVLLSNPDAWADVEAAFGEKRLLVVEGEPDYLAAVTTWPEWPVLGIYSGSWADDIAARIPDGTRVVIGTDHDMAGDLYARTITQDLEGRCVIQRREPAQ